MKMMNLSMKKKNWLTNLLYIVFEEQNNQTVIKIEVQKDFIKIDDEVIEQEEKERIDQERLENFNACIHGRRRYEYSQCKIEQHIYNQLEILPQPSLNTTQTIIESDLDLE